MDASLANRSTAFLCIRHQWQLRRCFCTILATTIRHIARAGRCRRHWYRQRGDSIVGAILCRQPDTAMADSRHRHRRYRSARLCRSTNTFVREHSLPPQNFDDQTPFRGRLSELDLLAVCLRVRTARTGNKGNIASTRCARPCCTGPTQPRIRDSLGQLQPSRCLQLVATGKRHFRRNQSAAPPDGSGKRQRSARATLRRSACRGRTYRFQ